MDYEFEEVNKIIHIKCTEEEKEKIITELSQYLYDYKFSFIIEEDSKKHS